MVEAPQAAPGCESIGLRAKLRPPPNSVDGVACRFEHRVLDSSVRGQGGLVVTWPIRERVGAESWIAARCGTLARVMLVDSFRVFPAYGLAS